MEQNQNQRRLQLRQRATDWMAAGLFFMIIGTLIAIAALVSDSIGWKTSVFGVLIWIVGLFMLCHGRGKTEEIEGQEEALKEKMKHNK